MYLGYHIKLKIVVKRLTLMVYKSEYLNGVIANDEWNTMTYHCGITRIQNNS